MLSSASGASSQQLLQSLQTKNQNNNGLIGDCSTNNVVNSGNNLFNQFNITQCQHGFLQVNARILNGSAPPGSSIPFRSARDVTAGGFWLCGVIDRDRDHFSQANNSTTGNLLEKDYNNALGIPFNNTNPYNLDNVLQAGNEPDFYGTFGKRPAVEFDYFGDIGQLMNQMGNDPLVLNRTMLLAPSVATGPWTRFLEPLIIGVPAVTTSTIVSPSTYHDPQQQLYNYLMDNYTTGLIEPRNATPAQVKVKYLLASVVTQKGNFTWAGLTFDQWAKKTSQL
ncbi:hypothetical protein JOM56_011135 [Amanita muscaria]